VSNLAYSLQLALAAVFAFAALSKLRTPGRIAQSIQEYKILPERAASLAAVLLFLCELAIAALLFSGYGVQIGLTLAVLTILAFFVGVLVNLHRGRRIPCGCFGSTDETLSGRTVARLVVLLTVGVLCLTGQLLAVISRPTVGAVIGGSDPTFRETVESILIAAFAIVAAQWLFLARELAEIFNVRQAPAQLRVTRQEDGT
jgi:membrane protease YdiL (CAAX protease family)